MVEGKTWTGFADAEEAYTDGFVGQRIQPFGIETEAKKIPNTNYINAGMFKPFVIQDGNLITGQQHLIGKVSDRLKISPIYISFIKISPKQRIRNFQFDFYPKNDRNYLSFFNRNSILLLWKSQLRFLQNKNT